MTIEPDLLLLLLRMVITAGFVVTASVITERSGPVVGALVATLPISAGPSYLFLSLDHDAAFIAQSALASLPANAATIFLCLTYVVLAQRRGPFVSLAAGVAVWVAVVAVQRQFAWTFATALLVDIAAFAICLPLLQRYRHVTMPLIIRRWYDVPLRAGLVATLVASVVLFSGHVGPGLSGVIAIFPIIMTSLMLILHPRIGGKPTAALIANSGWGLFGFGFALALLHLTVEPLGLTLSLSLGLAFCVGWNLALWRLGRWRAGRA